MNPVVQLQVSGKFPEDLIRSLMDLAKNEVLVGVPEKTTRRNSGAATNALLAYVHDQGSPLKGIPQREFLRPGIKNATEEIVGYLGQAGRAAMANQAQTVERALMAAGLAAQKSVRRKIQTGPFTPLKASTIRGRIRRHKGRKGTSTTPLIDTGALLQSINFVIRKK